MSRLALPMVTCSRCAFNAPCGGVHGQQRIGGCFQSCGIDCGGPPRCDWVCPAQVDFVDHVREVGGLDTPAPAVLPLSADLPLYIPMVRHGSSREDPFSPDVVAVSLPDVLSGGGRGTYGSGLVSGAQLRGRLKVRADAGVLLVCVADDGPLERYWALRKGGGLPERLAHAGVLGATIPNFSVFDDAPRTHTLWNWRRMAIVADELSAVGVAVVPHLNSGQQEDWERWYGFLRDNPGIRYVAKEFQTGLRVRPKGLPAIRALASLQERLGRRLHPVVVGGVAYAADFGRYFDRATFVDSQPFIKSLKRQRRGYLGRWEPRPTVGMVDDLLEENIAAHRAHVQMEFARGQALRRAAA